MLRSVFMVIGEASTKIVVLDDHPYLPKEDLLRMYFKIYDRAEEDLDSDKYTITIFDECVDEVLNHIKGLHAVGALSYLRFEIHQNGRVIEKY